MAESRLSVTRENLSGADWIRLSRQDRDLARRKLRELDPERQALACQEVRPAARSEFLMLLDHPENVVPCLSEADICITLRAGGMSEAAWLLELATAEQIRACFDLDCWKLYELDRASVLEWVGVLVEAGRPTLVRAIRETDLELWVLALKEMTEVAVLTRDDVPPEGWFTIDGVVYFGPRGDSEPARVREIAGALFELEPPLYWLLVYGMIFESTSECEEYALRWRGGRLNDLGFPDRERAMRAYRPLQPKEAETWEIKEVGEEVEALIPSIDLPDRLRGTLLGQALLELPSDRAADILGYVLAVANTIAVADDLSLSDAESIPAALAKAVRGIDMGLRERARVQQRMPSEVLDRTRPLDLFRIAATQDRALRGR